jgi:beta-lactamase regulating signal transducer with metallopeptidase domain
MGIGTSIFLIAIGAILRFAVTATVSGVNIHTVGTILLVVGIVGLLISLLYMTIWADRTRGPAAGAAAPPPEREVVRERY